MTPEHTATPHRRRQRHRRYRHHKALGTAKTRIRAGLTKLRAAPSDVHDAGGLP